MEKGRASFSDRSEVQVIWNLIHVMVTRYFVITQCKLNLHVHNCVTTFRIR